jgi:hypothetical protein
MSVLRNPFEPFMVITVTAPSRWLVPNPTEVTIILHIDIQMCILYPDSRRTTNEGDQALHEKKEHPYP